MGVLIADLYAMISQRVFNCGGLERIMNNVGDKYANLDLNNIYEYANLSGEI